VSIDPTTVRWKFEQDTITLLSSTNEITPAGGVYREGDTVAGWTVVFIGECAGEMAVLEKYHRSGSQCAFIRSDGKVRMVSKPDFDELSKSRPAPEPYFGRAVEDVLAAGSDILAADVLASGEPTLDSVRGVLPRVEHGAYGVIASRSSWHQVMILPDGSVVPHETNSALLRDSLFSPRELDPDLGRLEPAQGLLDRWLPILVEQQSDDRVTMETTHFVEEGDPHGDPLVWIRAVWFSNSEGKVLRETYMQVSRSRSPRKQLIRGAPYWQALWATIASWDGFLAESAEFDLPDRRLSDSVKGCVASIASTFSGHHPHYGAHDFYGEEIHDMFPPTVLTAVEAYAAVGLGTHARRIVEHILEFGIDFAGRFVYRQGPDEALSASGTEYGQWLWLLGRLEATLGERGWLSPYIHKLEAAGHHLLRHLESTAATDGERLIVMCAEADNSSRLHPYTANNLWVVRGLRSLGDLLRVYGRPTEASYFVESANEILASVREVLNRTRMQSPFGPLVPFLIGYSAEPWTLSNIGQRPAGVDIQMFNQYLKRTGIRDQITGPQDLSENTFANYRYYLEMLSAMLLEPEESAAIVAMRRSMGGEMLGMTRFYDRLDDWPAASYARYLLASDDIDAFLLLLFAHLEHHGVPELMTYFEQVSVDGRVVAPDCVPSAALIPTMVAWMFSFEATDSDVIDVLRGVPVRWYQPGQSFGVNRVGTTAGPLSIRVSTTNEAIQIRLELPEGAADRSIRLHLRGVSGVNQINVTDGQAHVDRIEFGNRIHLRKGTTGEVKLHIRPPGGVHFVTR